MATKLLQIAVFSASFSYVWASCAYGTLLHPRAEEGAVEINTFGYIGIKGPTNWVALDPAANALCAAGKNQSPIDMTAGSFTAVPAAELALSIPDMPEGATFENLGTTVEVVMTGGEMSFQNINYTLQQFHFHLPSEHLDDGKTVAMEMHMVWESSDAQIAVIGAFVDINDDTATNSEARRSRIARKGLHREAARKRRELPSIDGAFFHVNAPTTAATTASTLLETVLGSVQEIASPGTSTTTQPLVMSELVQTLNSGSFQTYSGSLTTPPCSEGVRWFVSNQKLGIKASTFMQARSVIGFNSRFPQNSLGEENLLAAACGSS